MVIYIIVIIIQSCNIGKNIESSEINNVIQYNSNILTLILENLLSSFVLLNIKVVFHIYSKDLSCNIYYALIIK